MLPSSRHSTFLDIGQNLGFHSFLFAQAGFHVIGIEAMAQNRHATEATLCLNPSWLPHVRTIPVALASPTMNGSSCLAVSSGVNAGNGRRRARGGGHAGLRAGVAGRVYVPSVCSICGGAGRSLFSVNGANQVRTHFVWTQSQVTAYDAEPTQPTSVQRR